MKILLVGEYSRLHNSLKEGLLALGHEVTLISTGDHFKNYPADLKLEMKYHTGFMKYVKVGLYKVFGFDITAWSLQKQFFRYSDRLKGFDVVQLINESPFGLMPSAEKKMIAFLVDNNKKLFLLACGTDYLSVQYELSDALPYSIMHEYKNRNATKDDFKYILKYTKPAFKDLHRFVYNIMNGVIASDFDYHLPLKEHPKYLGLIPNPVNTDELSEIDLPITYPIVVFLGINRAAYHTKGIRYFEEALATISEKHPEKISVEIVEDLPYATYIEKYNRAHIVLDQVLGFDQGYNALEAMAKGKVVFTGAEKEFETHYRLNKKVAINALPNAGKIAAELERLLLDPSQIRLIGKNAREFVLQYHHYQKVAGQYIEVWNAN